MVLTVFIVTSRQYFCSCHLIYSEYIRNTHLLYSYHRVKLEGEINDHVFSKFVLFPSLFLLLCPFPLLFLLLADLICLNPQLDRVSCFYPSTFSFLALGVHLTNYFGRLPVLLSNFCSFMVSVNFLLRLAFGLISLVYVLARR